MIIQFFKIVILTIFHKTLEIWTLAKLKKKYANCDFYIGAKIANSKFGNYNVIFRDVLMDGCNIGDHTYVQKGTAIFNANVGKFCSIASNVSIGPGIHKIDGVSTHPSFYLKNTPLLKKFSNEDSFLASKTTTIGNDVWIGEKSIILDGITIGTGAIIAAGSVVTKDVSPYSIVGGIPAKVIKFRFTDSEIDFLLSSEWWNFSNDWFENNYRLFNNVSEFLLKTKAE